MATDEVVLGRVRHRERNRRPAVPVGDRPIDVSDLAPGTYTFVAMTDDPSGGEGLGPFTDTRTIIVE